MIIFVAVYLDGRRPDPDTTTPRPSRRLRVGEVVAKILRMRKTSKQMLGGQS